MTAVCALCQHVLDMHSLLLGRYVALLCQADGCHCRIEK
jgi:hypothetical protein